MFYLDFLRRSLLMGTTLRAALSKSYGFPTNYHTHITMPTWRRCAPPNLFWPWPPYSLIPRSCLTWIFFVDPYWWVPLCVQHPTKAMPFQQISMPALQCQHDVDVHLLFILYLDLYLTCFQGHVKFWCSLSILTDGYQYTRSVQKSYAILANYHVCIALPSIYLICSCFFHA